MEAFFLRMLATACVVSLFLIVLLFPARTWLATRYAPQMRWGLWRGLGVILILGIFFSGFAAIPGTRWVFPNYSVNLPSPEMIALEPQISSDGPADPDPVVSFVPAQVGESDAQPDHTGLTYPSPVPQTRTVSATWMLGAVWLAGAGGVLAWQMIRYFAAKRRLLRASFPSDAFDPLLIQSVRRPVSVRILPGLSTPLTLGVLRPVVLLPQEQVPLLALRHELTHIQRWDLAWKTLLLAACALYWFDPLVWYLFSVAEQDMEAACDGQLARNMSPEEKRAYGELLLRSASKDSVPALSTRFGSNKRNLKSRLTQLFRPGKTSHVPACVLLCLAFVLTSLLVWQSSTASSSGPQVLYAACPDLSASEDGTLTLQLVDFVPGPDWMGSPYDTVTYHVSEEIRLTDGATQVDTLPEFLSRHQPQFREGDYTYHNLLRVEVESDRITAMSWYLGVTSVGGCLWQDPSLPYVFRLPESWRDHMEVTSTPIQSDGQTMTGYQAEFWDKNTKTLLLTLHIRPEEDFYAQYGSDSAEQEAQGIYSMGGYDGWAFWADLQETQNQLIEDFRSQIDAARCRWLGSSSYTSARYGFTLSLPESWRTLFFAQEEPSGVEFRTDDMGWLATLEVRAQPAAQEELDAGLVELSRGENDLYLYLSVAEPTFPDGVADSVQEMEYVRLCQDLRTLVDSGAPILTIPAPDSFTPDLSLEPPLSQDDLARAVPDFLTPEQQQLYRRACSFYTHLFGGETGAVEYSEWLEEGAAPLPEEREQVDIGGYTYWVSYGLYADYARFDAVRACLFTDGFWQTRNALDESGTPIFTEYEGRLCYLDLSRGSGYYRNSAFPDTFTLVSESENEIVFTVTGYYLEVWPPEGISQEEWDVYRQENYAYTLDFTLRLVNTPEGWRFDQFYETAADEQAST